MKERSAVFDTDILLVVDVQNDFCPEGALAVPEGDQIVPTVNRLMKRFPHVVLTQDWHPPDHLSFASMHPGKRPLETIEMPYGPQILWPDHCVRGTPGAAFHPDLETTQAELILRKGYRREIDSYSALVENDRKTPTGLAGYLRERNFRRMFICGMATDFCVLYSVEDACAEGFEVVVIIDACRGIDTEGSLQAAHDTFSRLGVKEVQSRQFA